MEKQANDCTSVYCLYTLCIRFESYQLFSFDKSLKPANSSLRAPSKVHVYCLADLRAVVIQEALHSHN